MVICGMQTINHGLTSNAWDSKSLGLISQMVRALGIIPKVVGSIPTRQLITITYKKHLIWKYSYMQCYITGVQTKYIACDITVSCWFLWCDISDHHSITKTMLQKFSKQTQTLLPRCQNGELTQLLKMSTELNRVCISNWNDPSGAFRGQIWHWLYSNI